MDRFEIDPDIRKAWTPPGCFYSDPDMFHEQRESVFARSWQWLCDDSAVRVAGQVAPMVLLEGCLNEPIVLTRDSSDQLHCMSNVCTHRGNLVCEHAGMERHLRCRYHGRRFGLDGQFQFMPEFEGVEGFPCEADHLAKLPLERWGPFLFTSLNASRTFEDTIGPMRQIVEFLPLHEFKHDPLRSREYVMKAHWALYVENYLEGFHIPFIHAGLNEALDYGSYRTELFDQLNLQVAVSKGSDDVFELPSNSPFFGESISAFYFWVYPNLMFNFYPWGLSVNVVRPLGPDRTKVSFYCYPWRPELMSSGAGADLDRVEREDEAVVETVHVGLKSRLYHRGRYAPVRELGTHHFHRLLVHSLFGAP